MLLSTALRLHPDPARPEIVAFVGAGGKSSALFRLAAELTAQGARVITTTTTRIAAAQIVQAPAYVPVTQPTLPLSRMAAALDAHGHVLLIGRDTAAQGPIAKKAGIEPAMVDEIARHAVALGVSAILIEADGSRMLPAKAPALHEPVLPAGTTLLVPIMGLDAIGCLIDDAHVHRPKQIRMLLDSASDAPDMRLTPAAAARLLSHPQGGLKARPGNARVVALLNKADSPPRRAIGRVIAKRLAAQQMTTLLTTLGVSHTEPVLGRDGPVAAIILAAGGSTRMGRPKQLIEFQNVPLVVHALRIALASGVQQVLIVTGAQGDAVAAAIAGWTEEADRRRVQIVHNQAWATGQASSLRVALAELDAAIQAALFLPVDQPLVQPELLRRLIRAWQQGERIAAPFADGQMRGAPALFDRSLWSELSALSGDVGGRPLLQRYAQEVIGVPVAGEQLRDVDRPQDLVALQNSAS